MGRFRRRVAGRREVAAPSRCRLLSGVTCDVTISSCREALVVIWFFVVPFVWVDPEVMLAGDSSRIRLPTVDLDNASPSKQASSWNPA